MGRQSRACVERGGDVVHFRVDIDRAVGRIGWCARVRACVRACVVVGAKAGLIAGVQSLGVGHPSCARVDCVEDESVRACVRER